MTYFEKTRNLARDRMLSALSAYYIWKWLHQAINVNNEKGKAIIERNLKIINRHKAVWQQITVSVYKSFVADLAIFFDTGKYGKAFSWNKLLEAAKEGLSEDRLLEIRNRIDQIKRSRGKHIAALNSLRNSHVAHQEMDSQEKIIQYSDIEDLFSATQEILNLISAEYNGSSYLWTHVEQEVFRQMEWIFDNLENGEGVRREEATQGYKNNLLI